MEVIMPTQQERIAKTKAAITAALVHVGSTKPLTQITVSDLTRASGISRGTFYLHYLDKEDLVTQLETYFTNRLQQLLTNEIDGAMDYREWTKGRPYPIITDVIALAAEDKELLRFLFGINGDPDFTRDVTARLQTAIVKELTRVKGNGNFRHDIPREYALNLVTNAIMTIVTTWLVSADDMPQDAVAALIMRALYLSPYDILGITISK
jgi:AcrR family transcriptional regulator